MQIDYTTRIVSIPQTDLTLISGTVYSLDSDALRLLLKAWEASEEGMPMDDTHRHNTTVTVAGVTYARTIEIINGYSIEFEDGQYTVIIVGSNNNFHDVLNGILVQNQVQVIPSNSAGLQVVETGTSGLTVDESAKLTSINLEVEKARKLDTNRATIADNPDGSQTITIYDDDNVTPIHVHTVNVERSERVPV